MEAKQSKATSFRHEDVRFSFQQCTHVIPKKNKVILENVSGSVVGGQMLAIVGPSGAGKTMLMKLLTLENAPGARSGIVKLDGKVLGPDHYRKFCASVPQVETLWTFLTARDHLYYALRFYHPHKSEPEVQTEVDRMLKVTGLETCQNTRAGNALIAGLSGGQRRRLSFACGLLKSPRVLFLDEPTSGLDAAAAASIVQLLRNVAERTGIAVICTIHQPSSRVFHTFDRVLLLSGGRPCYEGKLASLTPYLEQLGHPLPSGHNVADFALELVNRDFTEPEKVDTIIRSWNSGHQPLAEESRKHASEAAQASGTTAGSVQEKTSCCSEMCLMTAKLTKLTFRDPLLYLGRMVFFIVACSFFAVTYIEARERNQTQIQSKLFLTMWFTGVPTMLAVIAVFALHAEYSSIRREVKEGMYTPVSYMVAHAMLQIPFMIVLSIASLAIPAYGISNFYGPNFGSVILVYSCMLWAFECCAQFFSVAVPNPLLGMLYYLNIWFMAFLFCGVMLPFDDVIWPLRVFCYILPDRWAFSSLVYAEYIDAEFSGTSPCNASTPGCNARGFYCPDDQYGLQCFGKTGKEVLQSLNVNFATVNDESTLLRDVLLLLAQALVWKVGSLVMLFVRSRPGRSVSPPSDGSRARLLKVKRSAGVSDSASKELQLVDVELEETEETRVTL